MKFRTTFIVVMISYTIILLCQCESKSKGYVIHGDVEGFQDSTMLYLLDTDIDKTIDSTMILNGQFEFRGKVKFPKRFYLQTKYEQGKHPYYTSFWVENSNIKIEGTAQNFTFADVTGSEPQKIANILQERIKTYHKKRDSLTQIAMKMRKEGADKNKMRGIWQKINQVDSVRNRIIKNFVKEYTNSYEALNYLHSFKTEMPIDTVRKLYKSLEPKYKNSKYAEPIKIFVNSKLAEVGEDFVDFKAQTLDGNTFKLSKVIGDKYVLLDFWGSGCGPCRMANKHFAKNYSELKDNLNIVSFAIDKNKERVVQAAEEDSIQWTVVSNYKGNDGPTPIKYQIRGIPTFYIINPSGKIVKKYVGFSMDHITKIKNIIKG